MALGIIKQEFEPTATIPVKKGDVVYAYSDGITDVINSNEEEFGQERLEQKISELLSTHSEIDFLSNTVDSFRGEMTLFDDVTLVELLIW